MVGLPRINQLLGKIRKNRKTNQKPTSRNFLTRIVKILGIAGSTLFSFSKRASAQKCKERVLLKPEKEVIQETIQKPVNSFLKKTSSFKIFKKGRKMKTETQQKFEDFIADFIFNIKSNDSERQKDFENFIADFIFNIKSNGSEESKEIFREKTTFLPRVKIINQNPFFKELGLGVMSTGKVLKNKKILTVPDIKKVVTIRSLNKSKIILTIFVFVTGTVITTAMVKKLLSLRGGSRTPYNFDLNDSFKASSTKSKILNFLKEVAISIPVVLGVDWLIKKFRKNTKPIIPKEPNKEIPTIETIEDYYESLKQIELDKYLKNIKEISNLEKNDSIRKLEKKFEEDLKKWNKKPIFDRSLETKKEKNPEENHPSDFDEDDNLDENNDLDGDDDGDTNVKTPKNTFEEKKVPKEEEEPIDLAGF